MVDELADWQPWTEARSGLNVARLGVVAYPAALCLQDRLVNARRNDLIPDTLLLLEHPHVFTLGRGADERYLINPPPKVPVHRVSRGGQVTYHGPGQLVGYPILKLEGRDRDVHCYLRTIERVIIDALNAIGIVASRRDKLTGVWAGDRKIASIGVGIRRWVTFHGFAVNADPAMSYFKTIVPCGIEGCEMTSIAELIGLRCGGKPLAERAELMDEFTPLIQRSFTNELGYRNVKVIGTDELWRQAGENYNIDNGGKLATAGGDHPHG